MYTHYENMLCACYSDIASAYPAQNARDHDSDLRTIRSRFAREGIAFLTKTLPAVGKAIDSALTTSTPLSVPNFQKRKGTNLPKFMGWLFEEIFSSDGLEKPNVEMTSGPDALDSRLAYWSTIRSGLALRYLRQLSYLFYKLEMPYDEQSINRVLRDFVQTDEGVGNTVIKDDPATLRCVKYASNLVKRVLGGTNPRDIVPKHGPGSVATGEKSWQKPYFCRDYVQATSFYPLDEYYYFNSAHVEVCLRENGLNVRDSRGRLRAWKTMETSTAKVVLVPKDSRGPRLISMEPLEIQWLQQGQCELLVRSIESHWLTKGHVNFQDQSINRWLAWLSSIPTQWRTLSKSTNEHQHTLGRMTTPESMSQSVGKNRPPSYAFAKHQFTDDFVTLDMKEASDRISLAHLSLFPSNWVEALMSTRSTATVLPNGSRVELNKFAPMGSAVCFPVEALTFWALALSAIRYTDPLLSKINDGKKLLSLLRERVWVYGDDLIIRREDYPAVREVLEKTGLLLNSNKCCLGAFFRESCGLDAYKGFEVTPLRIKQCLTSSYLTGQQLMSYVSYSNRAHERGFYELANYIENIVSSIVPIPFTTVDRGYVQFVRPYADVKALNKLKGIRTRFNTRTCNLEAYGPTPRAVVTDDHNVTWESYASRFLQSHRDTNTTPPSMDPERYDGSHMVSRSHTLTADQYSVPRRVTSNRGWKQVTL